MSPIKIAIFASGSGSNAEKIIQHFQGHSQIEVWLVLTNKPNAFVLERAAKLHIATHVFNREEFYDSSILDTLRKHKIDYLILAGFLWLLPNDLIDSYRNKIINIHPSLLPKYGGKGMYGDKVHQAVLDGKETESGITIHLVDEIYDNGKILFQSSVSILENETVDSLAQKIHTLEHVHFPETIEKYIRQH